MPMFLKASADENATCCLRFKHPTIKHTQDVLGMIDSRKKHTLCYEFYSLNSLFFSQINKPEWLLLQLCWVRKCFISSSLWMPENV